MISMVVMVPNQEKCADKIEIEKKMFAFHLFIMQKELQMTNSHWNQLDEVQLQPDIPEIGMKKLYESCFF